MHFKDFTPKKWPRAFQQRLWMLENFKVQSFLEFFYENIKASINLAYSTKTWSFETYKP